MAKSVIKYRVRVSFVDDTYWDDGSRWTYQTFKFNKRQEAIDFANNAMSHGCTVSGQNGNINLRPDKRDITIYRDASSEVTF